MSDGHFFHDLIEGIVIWEDSDTTRDAPIKVPVEATPENLELHHAPVDEQMIDAAPAHDVVASADANIVEAHGVADDGHAADASPAHQTNDEGTASA